MLHSPSILIPQAPEVQSTERHSSPSDRLPADLKPLADSVSTHIAALEMQFAVLPRSSAPSSDSILQPAINPVQERPQTKTAGFLQGVTELQRMNRAAEVVQHLLRSRQGSLRLRTRLRCRRSCVSSSRRRLTSVSSAEAQTQRRRRSSALPQGKITRSVLRACLEIGLQQGPVGWRSSEQHKNKTLEEGEAQSFAIRTPAD